MTVAWVDIWDYAVCDDYTIAKDHAAITTTALLQILKTVSRNGAPPSKRICVANLPTSHAPPLTKFVMKTSSSPGACYPAMPLHPTGESHGKTTRSLLFPFPQRR